MIIFKLFEVSEHKDEEIATLKATLAAAVVADHVEVDVEIEASSSDDTEDDEASSGDDTCNEDELDENEDPARIEERILKSNTSVRQQNKIAVVEKPLLKSCLKNGMKVAA